MAAAPQFAPQQIITEAARQSRRRLQDIHARTIGTAQQADIARHQEQEAQTEVRALESDPPVAATASAGHRIMTLLMPLFLAGAAFGEWVISVPTAVWLTVAVIGREDWIPWTRFALPAGILLADVLASYLRYRAREEALPGDGFDARQLLAWLMLAAMTMLSLATQLAVQPDSDADMQLIRSFWMKTAGLAMITAVLHGLILLNGRMLVESLALWSYLLQRSQRRNSITRAQNAYARHSQGTVTFFGRYVQEHRDHIQRFGPTEADAFDDTTRRVLRERLGYDPFAGPAQATPQENSSPTGGPRATPVPNITPPAPPVDPPVSNADEDYYRRIVEERQRDQEAEVRKEN